jgi:hypothetical protein
MEAAVSGAWRRVFSPALASGRPAVLQGPDGFFFFVLDLIAFSFLFRDLIAFLFSVLVLDCFSIFIQGPMYKNFDS